MFSMAFRPTNVLVGLLALWRPLRLGYSAWAILAALTSGLYADTSAKSFLSLVVTSMLCNAARAKTFQNGIVLFENLQAVRDLREFSISKMQQDEEFVLKLLSQSNAWSYWRNNG